MEEILKLRHKSWEVKKRIRNSKNGVASKLGEGGDEMVDWLVKMVESIEALLGYVDSQLQVPGGVVDKQFLERVNNVIQLVLAFLDQETQQNRKEGDDLANKLSEFMDWVKRRPSVIEEEDSWRQIDKDNILQMLIEFNDDCLVSVIPITGMPGTGKTTLAQFIYHSKRVYSHFDVRHWVSMSDEQGPSKLLDRVFRHQTSDPEILKKFHDVVDGKRYLLILDDVTQQGLGFVLDELLSNVGHGSKIVLTSTKLSTLGNLEPLQVSKGAPYELGSFSEDEALTMFQSLAFKNEAIKDNLIVSGIGLKICKNYARAPRILNNIAAFLSSIHTVEEWDYYGDKMFGSIQDLLDSSLSKVNLISYKDLPSGMQQCLTVCSLFPDEYEFDKDELIHLWAAQNFFTLEEEETSEEFVGDLYFRELHKNGYFLEHNKSDSEGDILITYKMDPLVKQFLKNVADSRFLERHSSYIVDSSWTASGLLDLRVLLSLLFLPKKTGYATVPSVDSGNADIISSTDTRDLRALDLVALKLGFLEELMKKLRDLRYLRLGVCAPSLSETILKLENLGTLDLRQSNIMVLPKNFHRMKQLKHLYTGDRLIDLPPKFGELTSLQTLDVFIVGENNGLDALAELKGLAGKLKIRYLKYKPGHANPTDILRYMHLSDVSLVWSYSHILNKVQVQQRPAVVDSFLEDEDFMQGFSNLHSVVSIHIEYRSRCQFLPDLSSLPRLRSLVLLDLICLEDISVREDRNNTSSAEDYFPSLECLTLANLPKLNDWSIGGHHQNRNFPCLRQLRVTGCPNLMAMPQMQRLESLELHYIHGKLLKHLLYFQESLLASSTLKMLTMVSVDELDSLCINLPTLESLIIRRCSQLENLVLEPPSNLKLLEIHECGSLHNIIGALKHLSALEKLGIISCKWSNGRNMSQNDDHDEDYVWQGLQNLHSLKLINILDMESIPRGISSLKKLESLCLHSLHKMRAFPDWICDLTQLQRLTIRNIPLLEALPAALDRLTALQQLDIQHCPKLKQIPSSFAHFSSSLQVNIQDCPKLERRCQPPDGEDWPLIQHFAHFSLQ